MHSDQSVFVWVPGEGPERTLGEAVDAAGRADLAVALPGIELFGDGLDRLVAAARSDSTIASASAMLSEGPRPPWPLPAGELADAAASVARHAARLRPRIGTPQAGCVLLRRTALDLVGTSDDILSPAAALAEFGERCVARGLSHVLADDVLAGGVPAALDPQEAAALDARYPHRRAAREHDEQPESPVAHAVRIASRGLSRLSVTIDGRALGPTRGGTQLQTLELIAALGRTGRVALRIVTPPDLQPDARTVLEGIDDIVLLPYEAAAAQPVTPSHIVHRPSQVFTSSDLALLLPLGDRLVVTHQDLILYRNPGYHDAVETWQRYRRATRDALAAADHVVFFSDHARRDALADALVDPAVASVVPVGVDHRVSATAGCRNRRPPALPDDDTPFLLCLGTDLPHKNHAFAVELAAALRAEHNWHGRVVLAGHTADVSADAGGVAASEVSRLGPVCDEEKAWLLEHAVAVVYPTLYEGFGLVPFEAAAAGTPCLFAAQAALAEVLPANAATLVAWNAHASAEAVAPLLQPGAARAAHVATLRDAATRYRWDDTARSLIDVYEALVAQPPLGRGRVVRERLVLEHRLAQSEGLRQQEWQRHNAFREKIGSDGLGLVGPGGVLEPADQRAMLALMSKPVLRRPVLSAARAGYRAAAAVRRTLRRGS